VPGQIEHLRSESGQDALGPPERWICPVEPVEESCHGRQGLSVTTRFAGIDQWGVTDPDAKQEAVAVPADQSSMGEGRLGWGMHPYIENASCDRSVLGGGKEVLNRAEDITADIRDPQGRVAEIVKLPGRLDDLAGVSESELSIPNARASQWRHRIIVSEPREEQSERAGLGAVRVRGAGRCRVANEPAD
jgi:hypothetical protein